MNTSQIIKMLRDALAHAESVYRLNVVKDGEPSLTLQNMQAVLAATAEVRLAQQGEDALKDMEARKDAAYYERNQVVAALAKCFPAGVAKTAIEGWSEDWHGCVYIDLPTGQVSWHFHDSQAHLFEGLPPYTGTWDGHDTPEKYRRVAALKPCASWTAASNPPDADTTVMLALADGEVWQGYWDGGAWIEITGLRLASGRVKYWMHTPAHPEDQQ